MGEDDLIIDIPKFEVDSKQCGKFKIMVVNPDPSFIKYKKPEAKIYIKTK